MGKRKEFDKKPDAGVQTTSAAPRRLPWFPIAVFVIAIAVGVVHGRHLLTLFENDKHFSHLADFEREMAYRTEMGLYYSYYKTMINAPTMAAGLNEITRDNVTEFGHEINTLKRFNLYPEVILAFLYRQFKWYTSSTNWQVEWCWQVNRGSELSPVQSCEGIGNAHYFYVNHAFLVAATVASSIFLLGVLISGTIAGGLISVASFAFNHGEATRVQWTPPLRESFAFPFIIAHIALLTFVIKEKKSGSIWAFLLASLALFAILFWQFSQFAFFTQICSLFVVFALDLLPIPTAKTIAKSHLLSFCVSFVLLFGNEMLLTTVFFPSIVAFTVVVYSNPITRRLQLRLPHLICSVVFFLALTLGLKIGLATMLRIEDDAHIFDILKSKFTNYANFHTRLYTCSAEFDFIQLETVRKLTNSLLIPAAAIAMSVFVVNLLLEQRQFFVWRSPDVGDGGEVVYNAVQLVLYTVMAVMIMRLKLFFTPHLCIFAALLANYKYFNNASPIKVSKLAHFSMVVGLLAVMAFSGMHNIHKQLSIRGEYSNPEQEMLFNWIEKNTPKNAVFAGTMPVMANVKLTTLRPIVNHPHYENIGIRERTLKVYSVFSRKPIKEVHRTLKAMGVNYVVFQVMNCADDPNKPQCVYRGMWDESDPANRGRPQLCELFVAAATSRDDTGIAPFRLVYNPNRNYLVLKV